MSGEERFKTLLEELLRSESREKQAEVGEILREIDVKKVALVLKEVSDNADAIIELIRLARAIKESGAPAALEGVLEVSDESFSAVARAEFMKAVGNAMMLVYMLSLFDHSLLMKAAEATPKCVEKALAEASENEKSLGLLELLRILRSPEMAMALRGLVYTLRCLRGRG